MAFNRLYAVTPSESSVPIHHERNMLRDWALLDSPDQQLSDVG